MSSAVIDVQLVRGPVREIAWEAVPGGTGAECVFLGRTRAESHPKHGALTLLRYEAYDAMAKNVLEELAQQAVTKFGCMAVRVHHAIGDVPVGDASVLINVLTGHRDKSFDACRFLIDALKKEAPIWKQEVWADGTTWSPSAQVPGGSMKE